MASAGRAAPALSSPQKAQAAAPSRFRVFRPLRASAAVYTAHCAGCHGGLDGSMGRAPNLFSESLLKTLTDRQITRIVRHGIPGTEMAAFPPATLSDRQLFELLSFIRTESGIIQPKVEFVADPDGKIVASEKQKFKIEVVTRGLETPWGMVFLPDGRLLISERPGHLRFYWKGKLFPPVRNTPVPRAVQDGGYFDVTISPQYAKDGWIYLAYSEVLPGWTPAAQASPKNQQEGYRRDLGPPVPSNTVIVRGRIRNNKWTDQQVLFRSPAKCYSSSTEHYGSRFLWDKQGHLFFTLGDRGAMQNAQDLTHNNGLGKIHRINADGSAPKDNPFVNRRGIDPTIWSYGHRNPEGLAWDPVTGDLWESEHGPIGGDEINIIKHGHNYGWGVISMGIQPGIAEQSHPDMEQPIVYYTPTIAPSAISFYTGDRYPGWKNTSLFVCGLTGQQLRRLEIRGSQVIHQEVVFSQFGRVRDIVQGPDGYFYLALQKPTGVNGLPIFANTPGMIVRLVPIS